MPWQRPPDWPVLEGIVTTVASAPAGTPVAERANVAPMGPIVSPGFDRFVLRPFPTATTYVNLERSGEAVFHVTDDALLIARGVAGSLGPGPDVPVRDADCVVGVILEDACRWYELRVVERDLSGQRSVFECEVVAAGRGRDFFGLHRARHAVLEAAILTSRMHLTGPEPVLEALGKLETIVEKTGTPREAEAMALLREHVTTRS